MRYPHGKLNKLNEEASEQDGEMTTPSSYPAPFPHETQSISDIDLNEAQLSINMSGEESLVDKDFDTKFWFAPDGRINLEVIRNAAWHHDGDDSRVPPYNEASGGREFEDPPPYDERDQMKGFGQVPKMNIVMHVVGSRQEVSHFIDLGRALQNIYGHRVRIATHAEFKDDVEAHHIEFFDIAVESFALGIFLGEPILEKLNSERRSVLQDRATVLKVLGEFWNLCIDPGGDGRAFIADAITASTQSLAHVHCAEKLGIPLHLMSSIPTTPTRTFPHPLVNLTDMNLGPHLANRLSYYIVDSILWTTLGPIINTFREEILKAEPMRNTFGRVLTDQVNCPRTHFRSQSLPPRPDDWPRYIYVLPSTKRDASNQLSVGQKREHDAQTAAEHFLSRLPVDQLRCAMLDDKVTAWNARPPKRRSKGPPVPLSAAAVIWLQKQGALKKRDVELFRHRKYDLADQALDPVSSLLSNTWQHSVSILQGAAASPMEAYRRVQVNSKTTEGDVRNSCKLAIEDSALVKVPVSTAKGIGQMAFGRLIMPVTFTHGLARGFHNIPVMYGDETVRNPEKIIDFKSGLAAAGKGLGYGLYDGVTGFFIQPVMGAKEDGAVGFCKGVGKGIGGLVCKPAAGACGVPGYAFMGIYKQVQKFNNASADNRILAGRIAQGQDECAMLGELEKADIERRWQEYAMA